MADASSRIKMSSSGITAISSIENRRRKNVTIRKPIILGTYAFMLSIAEQKKRGDNATHSWTCFLRSPDNEDISYYVKKVVFSLHPSFLNPNRVVEKCPFEVTECGWGEFDIMAKIYFVDSSEKPVEIKHFLRLYPPGTTDVRSVKFPSDNTPSECVASETYDEFIFYEPTEKFYEKLISGPIQPMAQHRLQPYFHKTDKFTFEKTLAAAHVSIQNEMASLRAEIAQITLDIQNIRENYYSLRPSEVAGMFPQQSMADQSPVSESKSSQIMHQQPELNLPPGGTFPQKSEIYARSPPNQKTQNSKFQGLTNSRPDSMIDPQFQSQNTDQIHQYDSGGISQVSGQQYHQNFQQQQHFQAHSTTNDIPSHQIRQGHSSHHQNIFDNSKMVSHLSHNHNTNSNPNFKQSNSIDGVNLDMNRQAQFHIANQMQPNRNPENPHTIINNNHAQYSSHDPNLPPKIEPHISNLNNTNIQ
ncbi:transcription factor TFIIF [Cryptosporidium ubiquitum]|uniref:Transcription factor TFIIF n=1 Tax=Cryptosporidium ubiquitum TaxID=857276 RepID=A0A1J4MDU6_9CRYT|nr:transcription factor TFIIF [Cryptosporidium ubiquitum]OII72410.1 transcription factor TFIIF [Cryptosporidium ubiquitum]